MERRLLLTTARHGGRAATAPLRGTGRLQSSDRATPRHWPPAPVGAMQKRGRQRKQREEESEIVIERESEEDREKER